ncbi:MAG: GNAT family N-acetyltransferase [Flavobacteriaceae bacterium]|nr:GNAT family N-acetyltransferase [Flavobacteriaceae bacterium]
MITIRKASVNDADLLSKLSIETFLPAHGHSASKNDIDSYISENFTTKNFTKELSNENHQYYLFSYNNKIVGYSKVVFNLTCENIDSENISYLSRIYFLKEYYGLGLAKQLFDFNIQLCKENNQIGMWLKVWIENKRAIQFYKKIGFTIVGKSDFRISENHSNPNHVMYLAF